jgi:hypothetical protein
MIVIFIEELDFSAVEIFGYACTGGWWLIVGAIMAMTSLATGMDPVAAGFATRFRALLGDLSTSIVPRGDAVVNGFWKGNAVVPWGEWIVPIVVWTLYFTVIFWVFLCIAAVLHKHWAEVIHLPYPLVEPVVEMTRQDNMNQNGSIPFWKNRIMWAGAAVPIIVGLWNDVIAKFLVLGLPPLLLEYDIGAYARSLGGLWVPLLGDFPPVVFVLSTLVIGVGYFVGNDILGSVVFFYFFAQRLPRLLPELFGGIFLSGLSARAWMYDQYYAGVLGFAVVTLYMSREQLKAVWLRAIGKVTDTIDSDEGLSYRTATFGLIAGLVIIALFNTVCLKVSLLYTIAFFAVSLALFLTFARARVQLGIPNVQYHSSKIDKRLIVPAFGGKVFGLGSINGSGFNNSLMVGFLGSGLAFMFESYKMADRSGMRRRTMSKALIFSVVASLLIGFVVGLPFIYEYGYNSAQLIHDARRGFSEISSQGFPRTAPEGTLPFQSSKDGTIPVQVIALVFTGVLAYMYSTHVWWSLHPLGYVMGVGETAVRLWSGFFIAWIIKNMLLRYFGPGAFEKARPFFMGLIQY